MNGRNEDEIPPESRVSHVRALPVQRPLVQDES